MTRAALPNGPLTIEAAGRLLRTGATTSVALTEELLRRADLHDADLGVYITRLDDRALAAAARADRFLAQGIDLGPLHGIPLGIKDIIATEDAATTAQSLVLDAAWHANRDAPSVARLRAAGAVIMGKLTTMEFATGLFDPAKPFPVPRNPWDRTRFPGGSSTGTGVGIAAGLLLGGLGTDTGGSIRGAASYSGVTGLKPTFGRVPKSGCVPVGYTLDTVGPMARTARDCAAILAVIAGPDPSDPCAVPRAVDDYLGALSGSVARLRIGVEREHHRDVDASVAACIEDAVSAFAGAGATVRDVTVPFFDELSHAANLTSRCEACAYHRPDLVARWDDYGRPMRTGVSSGFMFSGADYVQAQRVRAVGQRAVARLFDDVDIILAPTARAGAPPMDGLERSGLMSGILTLAWSAVGVPAMSLPMGFDGDGLPLGLQIVGRAFDEATVLRAGDAYQRMTDWHLQMPTLDASGA